MKNMMPKLLQGILIVLVSLSAAGCGGLDPASAESSPAGALTTTPVDPGAPIAAKTCVDGQKYGSCTCKSGGNGATCGLHTCMNCDPDQSPDGPNLACHCDTSSAVPTTPASGAAIHPLQAEEADCSTGLNNCYVNCQQNNNTPTCYPNCDVAFNKCLGGGGVEILQ